MGRKSTRENKTVFQKAREEQGLTVEKASELMEVITPERITKMENGTTRVQPDDVIVMAECYKAPELCNYYCSHECALGRQTVEEIEQKPFSQIAIETINTLNRLSKQKDRLLEIVEDGQVRPEEYDDFMVIKSSLDKMAASVNALQLWIDGQIAEGYLDKKQFGR